MTDYKASADTAQDLASMSDDTDMSSLPRVQRFDRKVREEFVIYLPSLI